MLITPMLWSCQDYYRILNMWTDYQKKICRVTNIFQKRITFWQKLSFAKIRNTEPSDKILLISTIKQITTIILWMCMKKKCWIKVLCFEKFYLFNFIFFKVKLIRRVLGWDICKNMQYVLFGLKGNHCLWLFRGKSHSCVC